MIVDGLRLDDHIEANLDGPLIGRPGVLESEGHGGVAVCLKRHDEQCLDLVFFLEGNLMIAEVTIEKGQQFVASGGVYNLIYPRQTEGVFRVVFVEISVINTQSAFFIIF